MATKVRLQGDPSLSYTRTIDNQVGPDTSDQSDRTVPTLDDTNTKWFDGDSGNDSTGTGTEAAPYATIQKALDERNSAGGAFVYCAQAATDFDQVYEEKLDLQGGVLIARDGSTFTIKNPGPSFSVLDDFAQDAYALIEWTISNTNYIIAATADGLYRSSDRGITFASWVLSGKTCRGMTLWDDGSGEDLYVCQDTDQYLVNVTSGGTATTYKDFSSDLASVRDVAVVNNVLTVVGNLVTATGSTIHYYNNSTAAWEKLGEVSESVSANCHAVVYDSSASNFDGVVCGDATYNDTDFETGIHVITSDGFALSFTHSGAKVSLLSTTRLWAHAGDGGYFAGNGSEAHSVDPYVQDKIWTDITPSSVTGNLSAMHEDVNGDLWLGTTSTMYQSKDDGASWSEVSLPASTTVERILRHKNKLIIADSDSNSTVALEDVMIKNSGAVGADPNVNGVIVDGDNQLGIVAFQPDFNIGSGDGELFAKYCKVKNCYWAWRQLNDSLIPDAGDNQEYNNGIIYDCTNGIYASVVNNADNSFRIYNNIIYNVTGKALHNDGAALRFSHNTVYNCGYGIYNENSGNFAQDEIDSIIWASTIADIYTDTDIKTTDDAEADYILYNTTAGPGTIEITNRFTANPLFVDEENNDFNLKDKANGYPVDSKYISGGDNDASDGDDLGAYQVSRSSTGPTYGIDFVFKFNPRTFDYLKRPTNFSSARNTDGEYSEYFSGMKRIITLDWRKEDATASGWMIQAHTLEYAHGLENTDFHLGMTDDDGSTWKALRSGTSDTVDASAKTITVNDDGLEYATNQWAGYWIDIDGTHYRIASHPSKASNGSCVFTLVDDDGNLSNGSYDWSIDFIKVKINSGKPFSMGRRLFVPEDFMSDDNIPITGYSLQFEEVT